MFEKEKMISFESPREKYLNQNIQKHILLINNICGIYIEFCIVFCLKLICIQIILTERIFKFINNKDILKVHLKY